MAALRAEAAVLARTPDAARLVAEAEGAADRNPVAIALARRAGALFRGDADDVLGTAAAFGQAGYPYQQARTLALAAAPRLYSSHDPGRPRAHPPGRTARRLVVRRRPGHGPAVEHVLRQCLISLRLAERMDLDEADRVVVYYTSLLAWVGCHVDAYEQAKWFGDDMALKTDFRPTDFGPAAARPLFILRHLGAGRPLAERARLGVTFPGDGRRVAEAMIRTTGWRPTDWGSGWACPSG